MGLRTRLVAGLSNRWSPDAASARPSRARVADSLAFGIVGVLFATWAVRIPAVSASLGLSEGDIALALLGLALGSIGGLATSGVLVSARGGRTVIRAGLIVYCLALPLAAFANGLWTLVGLLVVFGFGKGLVDVAANAQGVRIERGYPGQIMGSFHAMFSAGGLIGAGLGAVAAGIGLPVRAHFSLVGGGLLLSGLAISGWLLPKSESAGTGPTFALPSRTLVGFCAIGFCALFVEGVANDWSAVFLESATGAEASVAALGFAAFSSMMMVGRFLSDRAVETFGSHRFIRIAAVVSAAGLAITLVGETLFSLFGFGLLGLGLAGVMPVILSMAGTHDPQAPTEPAIAAVSSAGYGGFVIGPVAIGMVAETATLRLAFVPALVLVAAIVLFTAILPHGPRTAADGEVTTSD
ncbi:major facilitator transporter [Halostagnicola larsenii XH-48]|uniref:Major facilitator transporter n=1 Tax=Halostagnicola larsenii XH-48 TaxID=797299 RepID=W0JLU7_9EURY|nr:MFS transporter [Halostagnicola larsenii]AHF99568.1 major facilitator transporter [Halostagnicola larsenii XH-48]